MSTTLIPHRQLDMHPFSLLGLVPFFSLALAGSQVPVVDGVVGGVSQNTEAKPNSFTSFKPVAGLKSAISAAITPGKLRYVENSGVCGACLSVSGYQWL